MGKGRPRRSHRARLVDGSKRKGINTRRKWKTINAAKARAARFVSPNAPLESPDHDSLISPSDDTHTVDSSNTPVDGNGSDTPVPATTDTMASLSTDIGVINIPGTSKGRNGHHLPRSPRRPQRYAKIKAMRRVSSGGSEAVPGPSGYTPHIPSVPHSLGAPKTTNSRRCRDSVEIVMEETEGMQPASLDLDSILMSNREVPGARHRYRMSQSIFCNYFIYFVSYETLSAIFFIKYYFNIIFIDMTKDLSYVFLYESYHIL